MASRKVATATASLPSLLLVGAVLLLVMASSGAVAKEDAASGQFPSLDRTPGPEAWPKNNRAVRAGSTSLVGALPPAPKGSAAIPPQAAPAPQPNPCPEESDTKFIALLLILIILCSLLGES